MNERIQALNDAFDQVETGESDGELEASEPLEELSSEPTAVEEPAGLEEGDTRAEGGVEEPLQAVDPEIQAELDAAPRGLGPQAREDWKNTPESVRKELAKREKDFEKGITQYASDAKRARAMDQTLAPYQQLFAMNGGPQNTLPGLLQAAAVLQMGSGPQKAQTVANLVQQFGVDIRALDSALTGERVEPSAQDIIQQQVNQAVQPYQQQLQQMQQQQQMARQQQTEHINSEVNDFAAKNEFYADVKMDMADILDLAANRGQDMTLQDAYDKACQLRPEIASIIAGRQAAQSQQSRQRAAGSIVGSPSGGGETGGAQDIRATIENAWQTAGRV